MLKHAEIEIQVKRIIVATGWKPYDASRIENYSYAEEPDVVTNLEFEHMLAACTREQKKLTRPSDGESRTHRFCTVCRITGTRITFLIVRQFAVPPRETCPDPGRSLPGD